MEAIECIQTRRSVRKFTDRPVERDTVRQIVAAAAQAPSWKNTQIVRYTVVEDRAVIEAIAAQATHGFVYNTKTMQRSAALAVQSVVTGISGREPDGSFSTDKRDGWEMFDAGISAQTFCLAAHALGVGTVILGIVDDEKLHELLHLPETEAATAVIAMGYPVEAKPGPARKSVDELLRFV